MHNSKIEQLLEFLKEDPDDTFTRYALALEYDKQNDVRAEVYYAELLVDFPDYLATYYHAGKYYEKIDGEKAKAIYSKGISVALTQNNNKALQELRNALSLLEDEMED